MSLCSRCGAQFSCGMVAADVAAAVDPAQPQPQPQPCWCTALPALAALPVTADAPGSGCWCRACLTDYFEAQSAAINNQ